MQERNDEGRIPDEFGSYEEAAEFWDTHDTTDYPDDFQDVNVDPKLRARHFEVGLDEDLMASLRKRAEQRGITVSQLVNDLVREHV